ncbi:MAG: preprotein translocase subunit SecG [Clostridia bacterium]|nr:preprotein translocase subunit SecG [Clostridia bacterium]
MGIFQILIGIATLIVGIILIVVIMMQDSKNSNMSGVVTGNSESFFGSGKGASKEAKLSRFTTIMASVFAVLVVLLNIVVLR